ncbi:hypothetical protein [Mycobacterium phage WXIN]|nr:hypothetical protein [Mycobacterium phage WXIN]
MMAPAGVYLRTILETGIDPAMHLGSFAWADWEWVWRYGHLCVGCGYPAWEGPHGMSEYGGCV